MPVGVLTDAEEQELKAACRLQWVDDIPTRFAALPHAGSKLEIHTADQFPDQFAYTQSRGNGGGNENHFQGCQRLPGHYVAISGGDWRHASSHLFLGRLSSRAGRVRWGTNIQNGGPPSSDAIVARVDLHDTMWHAGGIDLCGFVLAVPIECTDKIPLKGVRGVRPPTCDPPRSRIVLVDVRAPAAPQVLARHIQRDGRKATAAALTLDPAGGYLLAVLRGITGAEQAAGQPKKDFKDKRIEFYRAADAVCGDFTETAAYMIPRGMKWEDYQTINFIRETAGPGSAEGRLYLCGMAGNTVDLFEVTFPAGSTTAPVLRFLTSRDFALDRRYAEFKAGVGVYTEGGTVALYAVPQWRRLDGRLGLTEWAS
jgi:hypothetical protein